MKLAIKERLAASGAASKLLSKLPGRGDKKPGKKRRWKKFAVSGVALVVAAGVGWQMLSPGQSSAASATSYTTAEGTREKTICLTESGQAYASRILEGIYEAEQSALRRTLEQYSDEFISAFECFTRYLCEGLADAETAEVKEEKQKERK